MSIVGASSLLRTCAKKKDLQEGARVHAEILKQGLLLNNPGLGSAIVNMYAKCGALAKAQKVMEELPVRNTVSWNALISGYAQQGKGLEAIITFEEMKKDDLIGDAITFTCILKSCGSKLCLEVGKQIHAEIVMKGLLGTDVFLGNALLDMYVKCGTLCDAQKVFDALPEHDVVTWNTLIAGYTQQGLLRDALRCMDEMQNEGIIPDSVTFIYILKACGKERASEEGMEIHDRVHCEGLLQKDVVLGNTLLDMYIKCDMLTKAKHVFDEIPFRDIVSWNSLISGYVDHCQFKETLASFKQMRAEGFTPDAVTFICLLKACGSLGAISKGKQLHYEILNMGLLGKDVALDTTLVDMYGKCGDMAKAEQVFEDLRFPNIYTWNVLLAGYVQQHQYEETLNCFNRMQSQGMFPDNVTFVSVLKACASMGMMEVGVCIHDEIICKGFLGKDIALDNALIAMYAKCGDLLKAEEVFASLPVIDNISWTTLITGYVHHEEGEEALNCFQRMQNEGFLTDSVTFICILNACGSTGIVNKGKQIHDTLLSTDLLQNDIVLGNTLLDMYAKCGLLSAAKQVFNELPVRTIVSWNALIAGYAQQGQIEEASACFKWMQSERVFPNEITFLSMLTACSHTGLVVEGEIYFVYMNRDYGLTPSENHHACLIDLYCRTGMFDKAITMVNNMYSSHYLSVWSALLSACRKWGNLELGQFAFEQALQVDPKNLSSYVLLTNIYAAARMKEGTKQYKDPYVTLHHNMNCRITLHHNTISSVPKL